MGRRNSVSIILRDIWKFCLEKKLGNKKCNIERLSVASQSKSSWRKKTLPKSYLFTMKPLTKHSLILCSSSPSRSTTCWILKDIEPTMHAQTMLYHSIWHLPPVALSCAIFIMKFFMYVLVQRWKLWWHVIWNISTAKYCKQIITEMWRLW